MLFFLIVLCLISIVGIKPCNFNKHYISKEQCASIKGIFIGLVFLSHCRGYLQLSDTLFNELFLLIMNHIGQLMVVMFLFYSGYGVMESYNHSTNYENGFFKNRIFKTLVHFDIAVAAFIVLSLILKQHYSPFEYILSFIGWSSIGNSNWYIFDILILYAITLFSFKCVVKIQMVSARKRIILLVIFTGTIVFSFLLNLAGKPTRFYNTILCYPFGVFYSIYKEKIEKWCNSNLHYFILLVAVLIIFIGTYIFKGTIVFSFRAVLFSVIIVLSSMKFVIGNTIIKWMGDHLFEIFILQRIPMIILSHSMVLKMPELFCGLCLFATLALVIAFRKAVEKVDEKLFPKNYCN